jgi:hypothetical protein
MSVSFTPEVKKLLTEAGCYFKSKGREIMKFGIAQLQIITL